MSISIISAVGGTAAFQGIAPYGDQPAKAGAPAAPAQGYSPADNSPPLDNQIPPAIVAMMIHQQLSNGSSFDT